MCQMAFSSFHLPYHPSRLFVILHNPGHASHTSYDLSEVPTFERKQKPNSCQLRIRIVWLLYGESSFIRFRPFSFRFIGLLTGP